jgi:hypothetical protein
MDRNPLPPPPHALLPAPKLLNLLPERNPLSHRRLLCYSYTEHPLCGFPQFSKATSHQMAATSPSPISQGSSSHHSMTGLRRCVICTGLSIFKRSKAVILNDEANRHAVRGTPNATLESASPQLGSRDQLFTCYGSERLAYVQAPPLNDPRLDQPDVAFMWCLGKSVFLLQSGVPGFISAPEKLGQSWIVSSSTEVPISYRGVSLSLSADEYARMPGQSTSSSARSPSLSSHVGAGRDGSAPLSPPPLSAPPVPYIGVLASLSQILRDLKPYVKESSSMLYEGLFSAQSHRHAATVLSQSVLSWSGHSNACRVLEAGHDSACSILHKALNKWFGSGGS